MKKQFTLLAITLLPAINYFAATNPELPKQNSNGISFTENKGQVHDQNFKARPDVLYGVTTGNMVVHIKKSGLSYQLYRTDSYKEVEEPKTKTKRKEIDQQTIYRIDLSWLNANTNFSSSQDEALPGYNNYYLESCPNGALNVRSYKGITLKNLYNGIDLHYYEKNGELKHDYIVAPHADYKQIQLKVEGADLSLNADGSLILSTPLGKIQEGTPIVYQKGKQLKAKWAVSHTERSRNVSFEIENYDPNYELVIDPITRVWGTYYGDSGDDRAYGTCTDLTGNAYIAGLTSSSAAIATSGGHLTTYLGLGDACLAKFDPNGIRLWGTYYGGPTGDRGNCCTADASGNVYLAGYTASTVGIVTTGCHQNFQAGSWDSFVVKFNSSGVRQWGTYYGGVAADYIYSCTTDLSRNLYIVGQTASSNIGSISTAGSHQVAYGGGTSDCFLVKFDSTGVRQWGTYYGGSTGDDLGNSCAIDNSGNIYLTGITSSSTGVIMATGGSHQNTFGGGSQDAFLAKFNSSGVRQWATYYGGASNDGSYACATDLTGNVYMAGYTYSSSATGTILATIGSYQSSYAGGTTDGFLVKFNSAGVRQWGSYYGGVGLDYFISCATDNFGNLYVAGNVDANSTTGIATAGSHQNTYGGGAVDGFLVKFNLNGVRQSGTYYGGNGDEYIYSCATDAFGSVYISGETGSNNGNTIASAGGHQTTLGGGASDAYLVKFDACDLAPVQPSSIIGAANTCNGSAASIYSVVISGGANSYTWSIPSGWSGASNSNTISATPGSSGIFAVVAGNACGVSPQQTLNVTVNPLPVITVSTTSALLCIGETATLTASGGTVYNFNPGGPGMQISISPTSNTTYTVAGIAANSCSNTTVFTQSVDVCAGIESVTENLGATFKIYPNPTNGILNVESDSENDIVIINTIGQVVCSRTINSGINQIDLQSLETGVYVIKVEGDGRKFKNFKLIIK